MKRVTTVLYCFVCLLISSMFAQEVLIEKLEGMLFVPSLKDVEAEGILGSDLQPLDNYKTINFSGIYPSDSNELKERLIPFLGQPITVSDLSDIKRIIEEHYIERNFPYMSIAVPVQAVRHNLLQVVILDGRLGELKVEGNQWFKPDNLKRFFRTQKGESINKQMIVEDVERMNKNPFRSVKVIFEEGTGEGETDIVLNVKDQLPVKLSVSTANNGNKLTDYNRLSASFMWGNAFWQDHLFNYQISGDP